MSYHYTQCGLDNVYLVNGFTVHQTKYGEGLSIENITGLHELIGRWVIELPNPLNGAELRFLRAQMDLSQKHLADIIGAKEQTLRLWEKNRKKAIPGPADRLVRALYSEVLGGDGSVRRMLDRLTELNQIEAPKICAEETRGGWAESILAA